MKTAVLMCAVCIPICGQLTYDRIRLAEREPGNWLTYSGNYGGHRYAALDQIDAGNVSELRPLWVYQTSTAGAGET